MLEKDIEKAFCKYCKSLGAIPYKFASPNRRSVPDRMVVYPGGILFIEFKAPGKKPTDAQVREMQRLVEMGQKVIWVDTKGAAEYALKDAMARRP